jgi:selenocysteine lyase/cysteine desulfurase
MKPLSDLSWGDPIVVRQALVETLGNHHLSSDIPIASMGYPPHLGSPKLIEQLRVIAKRQTGHTPKHLIATMGATGAINAALYAL